MKYPIKPCQVCGNPISTHWKPWRKHMAEHIDHVDDNKDCNIGNSGDIISPDSTVPPLEQLLEYAVHHGAVAIAVGHPKLFKKKRVSKQVLFITMGTLIGDPRAVVFGLAGGGCEVCKIDDLKVTPLIARVGLPAAVATELVETLTKVLTRNGYNQEK